MSCACWTGFLIFIERKFLNKILIKLYFCSKKKTKMFRPSQIILKSCITNHRHFSRRVVQPNVVRIIKSSENYKRQAMDNNINPEEYSRKHVDEGFQETIAEKKVDNMDKNWTNEKISVNIPIFEKNSHTNNQFSETIIKTLIKKDKAETVMLEGKRLINDAIENNLKITHIFFSRKDDLKDIIDLKRLIEQQTTKLVKVTYKEMKTYSTLKTPPGIMAIVKKPYQDDSKVSNQESNNMPLILICDNVRDPGNMGTIIRTSAAAGIEKIILTEGCVDMWNQKVIKAAAGAHFKIPIISKIKWGDIPSILPQIFDLYIADVKHTSNTEKSCLYYHQVNYFSNNNDPSKVLVIGNEAFGLSSNCYEFAHTHNGYHLKIPLSNNSESLNSAIASAILIYEIRRQFEFASHIMD